jgi:hypothetical protein
MSPALVNATLIAALAASVLAGVFMLVLIIDIIKRWRRKKPFGSK